jgi:DNA polymerase II small subunit/DNA polymerase delta subunit B
MNILVLNKILIYLKQANEKEIFDNQNNSEMFDEFLNFIGDRIKLKNFTG